MKKRILVCLMAVVFAAVLLCALPVAAADASGSCGDNLSWVLEDGVLTISGTGEMTANGWIEYKDQIEVVIIESGVTTICDSAFEGCGNLLEARVASSVTYVGFKAFAVDATRLFVYCEGDMPEFAPGWHNSGTTFLFYPEGNSTWDAYKTDKDYPGKVYKEKGNFDLSGTCGENLTYTINGTVLTISGTGTMDSYNAQENPPWMIYDRMITKLIIEEGVTTIGSNAFSQFEKITELNLPDSITQIGSMAFKDCYSLKEVIIPDSVIEIRDCAFDHCKSLEKITFGKGLDLLPMMVFMGCENLQEIYFTGDLPSVMYAFDGVTANAYYPVGNPTWTEEALRGEYGGTLTWYPWSSGCADGHTEEILKGKAPTCTKDGLTEGSHCAICGEVLKAQETVPATGHTKVTDVGRAATCTEEGLTDGEHCSVCDKVLTAQEPIPASGHSFGEWAVTLEPTVDAEGVEERICAACGATEQRTVAKLDPPETQPTEPAPTDPAPTDPAPTEPAPKDPVPTDSSTPAQTDPSVSQPEQTNGTVQPGTTAPTQPGNEKPDNGWIIPVVIAVLAVGALAVVVIMKRKK